MPPKPQVFKAPDGKEFQTRAEWRDYMMATFYSFKNKVDEPQPLMKAPGSIEGQMFDIADCKNSTLVVMDHTEQVQIDQLSNCRVFVAACASSIFIRNCDNCVFYTCCRQLRLREVTNSTFYIYSMAEVHIEYSNSLKFAPFNGGYPEHAKHLQAANLDIKHNLWYDIYDHNDPGKTHVNWSLLPESEYEAPWFPAGPCEPAIPRTKPGAVENRAGAENMQSFDLQQMIKDAQKMGVQPAAATAPAAPQKAPSPIKAAAPQPPAAPVVEKIVKKFENDDDAINHAINTFVGLKAGSSLIGTIAPTFTLILPNGQIANGLELEASAPHVGKQVLISESPKYSAHKDFAYVTAIVAEGVENGQPMASHYTFVLQKRDGAWLLVHAQKSQSVAA